MDDVIPVFFFIIFFLEYFYRKHRIVYREDVSWWNTKFTLIPLIYFRANNPILPVWQFRDRNTIERHFRLPECFLGLGQRLAKSRIYRLVLATGNCDELILDLMGFRVDLFYADLKKNMNFCVYFNTLWYGIWKKKSQFFFINISNTTKIHNVSYIFHIQLDTWFTHIAHRLWNISNIWLIVSIGNKYNKSNIWYSAFTLRTDFVNNNISNSCFFRFASISATLFTPIAVFEIFDFSAIAAVRSGNRKVVPLEEVGAVEGDWAGCVL